MSPKLWLRETEENTQHRSLDHTLIHRERGGGTEGGRERLREGEGWREREKKTYTSATKDREEKCHWHFKIEICVLPKHLKY